MAVIEELAKLLALLIVFRARRTRFLTDAVVLGAAAGMGFAAFESALYGWARLASPDSLLAVLWLRGLLSPFGHGTWTAVMAAGWWRWNRRSAERGCYAACMAAALYAAAAIGLHFLWDAVAGTGSLGLLLQLVIGACGLWLLRRLIRQGTEEEIRALLRINPDLAQAAGPFRRAEPGIAPGAVRR
nr:PrsW family glutamic-type intramembrane protease [Paenibacillus sp. A3]